jgi:hypothetical protein
MSLTGQTQKTTALSVRHFIDNRFRHNDRQPVSGGRSWEKAGAQTTTTPARRGNNAFLQHHHPLVLRDSEI